MKWLMEFYDERRGILARYAIEALLPADAVVLGRKAVLEEYPPPPGRRRLNALEQARRVEGQDVNPWVLYRIGKDSEPGSPSAARADAA